MRQVTMPPGVQEVEQPQLQHSLRDRRALISTLLSILTGAMTVLACVPLFSVLLMLLWRGGIKLSWQLFTELPPTAFEDGGGFGNAIVGTLVMVGIAALLSVPFGILAAVFLAEFDPESKTAATVRFCAKTLTGLPSILAGVFAYATVVLLTGTYSAPAGGIAHGCSRFALGIELGQEHCSENTKGYAQQRSNPHHDQGSDNGITEAAILLEGRGREFRK